MNVEYLYPKLKWCIMGTFINAYKVESDFKFQSCVCVESHSDISFLMFASLRRELPGNSFVFIITVTTSLMVAIALIYMLVF